MCFPRVNTASRYYDQIKATTNLALAASISPGPVNLVCLSSRTRYPVATGLVFVTVATLGFIALFIAVGLGLYSLLTMVPALKAALGWAGVAFLLSS